MKQFYRRHLPHYQPEETTYHTYFRLAGSLPESVLEMLRREKAEAESIASRETNLIRRKGLQRRIQDDTFRKFDALLDGASSGPAWLKSDAIAGIVAEAIHYRDGKAYDVLAFTIMPNHVHLVIYVGRPDWSSNTGKPSEPYVLTRILENLKWYTALKCNEALQRSGQFWQHESYDHVIREGQLQKTINYVLDNPVTAGLVQRRADWKWSYCTPGALHAGNDRR